MPAVSDASPTEHPPPPPPAAPPPVGLMLGAFVTVTLGPAVGETEGTPVTVGATVGIGVGVGSRGTTVTMFDVPSCPPPTTTSANQYCSPPVRSVTVTFDVVLVRFKPVTVL